MNSVLERPRAETEASSAGFEPAYMKLHRAGELAARAERARRHLRNCDLCARDCRVDRVAGLRGVACRTGEHARIASFAAHHGEEDCLRGRRGSGTIFFSWCNLRCVYCQNWEISWRGEGRDLAPEDLAGAMLRLQALGCHNVNLVSPSHVVAQILAALVPAVERGLRLPLVYNTGGYDSLAALALLDGVVDIYMPDMKYGDSRQARRYSHVRDYVRHNRAAVREMHRQVGDLVLDAQGIARRGLLVRHLVLPQDIAGTEDVIRFLAEEISRATYLNLLGQYRPCCKAGRCAGIDRPIAEDEYGRALASARRHGMTRLDPRAFVGRFAGFR